MALSDYLLKKPVIDTNRLSIRPMCTADVSALREWMPDKSIYTYWGKGPGKTDRNPELLFEKEEKSSKSFHLGIEEKSSAKVIGDIWVYLIEGMAFLRRRPRWKGCSNTSKRNGMKAACSE